MIKIGVTRITQSTEEKKTKQIGPRANIVYYNFSQARYCAPRGDYKLDRVVKE